MLSDSHRGSVWAEDMTLFDIVYLDIVHGFDVPIKVLLDYLGRGYSAEFVCRLGICCSCERFDQEKNKNKVKNSFYFKTLLMIQHALDHEIVSIEAIFTCLSILMKLEEFEIVACVLESGTDEFLRNNDSVSSDYVFASVVGNRIKNNLCEVAYRKGKRYDNIVHKLSVRVFF